MTYLESPYTLHTHLHALCVPTNFGCSRSVSLQLPNCRNASWRGLAISWQVCLFLSALPIFCQVFIQVQWLHFLEPIVTVAYLWTWLAEKLRDI